MEYPCNVPSLKALYRVLKQDIIFSMGPSTSFRKLNRPFYSCGLTTLGSVHTYPDILESATFSFWTRLSSTRIQWIQRTNPQLFESALQSGNFEYAMNPESCGRWIRIFFYPVMKQDRSPVLHRERQRKMQISRAWQRILCCQYSQRSSEY